MFVKSIVVGVVLVVAVAGLAKGDIWSDADMILADFIITVEAAIDKSSAELDKVQLQISDLSTKALAAADVAVEDLRDRLSDELDNIREQAGGANPNQVERCIAEYGAEVERLPIRVGELITDCVQDLDSQALERIKAARSQADGYLYLQVQFRNNIQFCSIDIDSDTCISRLVIEILLQTLEVPTQIEELTRRTAELTEVYASEVPLCARDRVGSGNNLADTILRIVRNCADVS